MSQTTLCRNFGGKGRAYFWRGRIFEGGVLAGHYSISQNVQTLESTHSHWYYLFGVCWVQYLHRTDEIWLCPDIGTIYLSIKLSRGLHTIYTECTPLIQCYCSSIQAKYTDLDSTHQDQKELPSYEKCRPSREKNVPVGPQLTAIHCRAQEYRERMWNSRNPETFSWPLNNGAKIVWEIPQILTCKTTSKWLFLQICR